MADLFKKMISGFFVMLMRFFQIKYWIFLGMIWIMSDSITSNLVTFCETTSEKTTPAVYAFIQSSPLFFSLYLLGVLCLFSDVPFCGRDQLYLLLREGRKKWYWRQVRYLFFGSFAAMLTAVSVCLVQLRAWLKVTAQWDRVLGTLAYTDAGRGFEMRFGVPGRVLAHYSPGETFWQAILIGLGVTFFLSVFLFTVSLCVSRKAAMAAASAMVLMCSLHKYYPTWMNFASPVSWIRTTALGMVYMDHAPGLSWVAAALPIVILFCVGIGYAAILKKDFNWTEEQ